MTLRMPQIIIYVQVAPSFKLTTLATTLMIIVIKILKMPNLGTTGRKHGVTWKVVTFT